MAKHDEMEELISNPSVDCSSAITNQGSSFRPGSVEQRKTHVLLCASFTLLLISTILLAVDLWQHHPQPFSHPADSSPTIEDVRLQLAATSIDMMQKDTLAAANQSQIIDIGPLYNLIDSALDELGVQGVYIDLFESRAFVDMVNKAAKSMGVENLKVSFMKKTDAQPVVAYQGVPNDRTLNNLCSGCKWWLNHFVGAITAEKLLREGSLRLAQGSAEAITDASSFMKELQRIERSKEPDIMVFHAQHGFIWQYLATKKPNLDEYPLEEAIAFCGELLYKDEYIGAVSNDMGRDCRHGFGHGVYFTLALQQMKLSADSAAFNMLQSARFQVRPSAHFFLNEEYICKASKICNGAPNEKSLQECKGGFRHSVRILGDGDGGLVANEQIREQMNACR